MKLKKEMPKMPKSKTRLPPKNDAITPVPIEVIRSRPTPLQDSRQYLLFILLAINGGAALLQGGVWIAVLLYAISMLALLSLPLGKEGK